MKKVIFLCLFFLLYLFFNHQIPVAQADINVYSAREEYLIKPVMDDFTAKTGIEVHLTFGKAEKLLRQIETEGAASRADLLITQEVGSLIEAREMGLLKKYDSQLVSAKINDQFADADNYWMGFAKQARLIVYSLERTFKDDVLNFENFSEKKWRGRICSGSSANIQNQLFVARLLYYYNVVDVLKYLNGYVSNFNNEFIDSDTEIIEAIANDKCDIAIVSHEKLATMVSSNNAKFVDYTNKVGFTWPNQDNRGATFSLASAALVVFSQNSKEAEILLKYLISDKAQTWFSLKGYEYPVVKGIKLSETVENFGTFKEDIIERDRLSNLYPKAKKMMSFSGWH